MMNFLRTVTGIFIIIKISGVIHSKSVLTKNKPSLKLVHVILRHGNRTPSQNARYPNDPHLNNTYPPFGTGQLTLEGKENSYILGQQIRNRYDSFLGSEYYPGLINSTSTSVRRAEVTLQYVHAGLFSSIFEEKLSETESYIDINHEQLIPYEIIPAVQNNLLFDQSCTKHVPNNDHDLNMAQKTQLLYDYVAYWSGYDRKTFGETEVLHVYDTILVENQMGLPVPTWAEIIYPEPLQTESLKAWDALNKHKLPLILGETMKRINTIHHEIKQSTLQPSTNQLFLYSCHDTNIASWLGIMDLKINKAIEYNAHVFVELHEIDLQFIVKVFYKNGINSVLEQLKLKHCDYSCPLEKFIKLTEWLYIP